MSLKAVLLNFNGVIINDEAIHQELINNILIDENLRPDDDDYKQYCWGKSDRNCLKSLLASRGRILTDEYIDKLIANKTKAYRQKIEQLATLPLYPHLIEFLTKLQNQGLIIGIVTGALRSEVEFILQKGEIAHYFTIIMGGDDLETDNFEADGYLLAIERLNQQQPQLNLQPSECLAIENNIVGIAAAKQAGVQVVGISHTYPLHMLQRQANWTVDDFLEIELERVERILSQS